MRFLRGALGAIIGASAGAGLLIFALAMFQRRYYSELFMRLFFDEARLLAFGVVLPGLCIFLIDRKRRAHLTAPGDALAVDKPSFILGGVCALGCVAIVLWDAALLIKRHMVKFPSVTNSQSVAGACYMALILLGLLYVGASVGRVVISGSKQTLWLRKSIGMLWSSSWAVMIGLAIVWSARAIGITPDQWANQGFVGFWLVPLAFVIGIAWSVKARSREELSEQTKFIGKVCVYGAILGALLHLSLLYWLEFRRYVLDQMIMLMTERVENNWPLFILMMRGPMLLGAACFGWFFGAGMAARKGSSRMGGRCGVALGLGCGILYWGIANGFYLYRSASFQNQPHFIWYVLLSFFVLTPALVTLGVTLLLEPRQLPSSSVRRSGVVVVVARLAAVMCGVIVTIVFVAITLVTIRPNFEKMSIAVLSGGLFAIVLFLFAMGRVGWYLGGLLVRILDSLAAGTAQADSPSAEAETILAEVVTRPAVNAPSQRHPLVPGERQP